jgi:predicted alpha/beta superfamily hydrolase
MAQANIQAVVLNEESSSQVLKIPKFKGSLPSRPLYIYTPPGYAESLNIAYPVIYMHDGQNVFESFVKDSFAGSWRADEVADSLITEGKMRPCIIVGISNGQENRLKEYQPPYNKMRYAPLTKRGKPRKHPFVIEGQADKTLSYYREVANYVKKHYRVLDGREHTATCGSSMGGLFSTYIAWEYPDFAQHHAALSPSYWTTQREDGKLTILEHMRQYPKRNIRLWLDSGEGTSTVEGSDDDNKFCTLKARAVLLEAGYSEGKDFVYYLAKNALHNEHAWANRLDKVFQFLMPA